MRSGAQQGEARQGEARRRELADRIREHRALIAVIAVAEVIAVLAVSTINQHDHIDGEVYQLGARAWLAGHDLYGDLGPTRSGLRLPFLYPPFAAIAFSPLAFASKTTGIVVISVLSHLALLAALHAVLSSCTFLAGRRDAVLLATAAALPLATIAEPVQETFGYAQINLVLMGLVAVDCLWRTGPGRRLPYPRGMLVGLAAGLKLTPAVFLLFFLLRKDYRAIATAVAGFAGTVLVGALLSFEDSRRFWLGEMLASSTVRFGPKFTGDASTYAGNQSLRSLLAKFDLPGLWLTVVFALVALLVATAAVLGMLHALRRRDLPLAVVLNGVLGLLVSPISWSHHWVWAAPALVLLLGAAVAERNWPLLAASSLVAGFFLIAPHWKMPQGRGLELRWGFAQQLLGNAYVYCGLAFVLHAAVLWWLARHRARERAVEPVVEEPVTAPLR